MPKKLKPKLPFVISAPQEPPERPPIERLIDKEGLKVSVEEFIRTHPVYWNTQEPLPSDEELARRMQRWAHLFPFTTW